MSALHPYISHFDSKTRDVRHSDLLLQAAVYILIFQRAIRSELITPPNLKFLNNLHKRSKMYARHSLPNKQNISWSDPDIINLVIFKKVSDMCGTISYHWETLENILRAKQTHCKHCLSDEICLNHPLKTNTFTSQNMNTKANSSNIVLKQTGQR